MSRGSDRRENDLANYEASFADALARAKAEPKSSYIAEKQGKPRGGATELDVELFTLESKIVRMREKFGLPAFVVPLPKTGPAETQGWPPPPSFEATRFPLDLNRFQYELAASGRNPEEVFSKVKYAGAKNRQGADQPSWRLAHVEVGDQRSPAKVTFTVYPLPEHSDAELAAQKLVEAMDRVVRWSEKAAGTAIRERPRLLNVTYTRANRELGMHAR